MIIIAQFFIDSNIFVHWLMGKKVLDYIISKQKLSKEFKNVYLHRYDKSIKFIDSALQNQEHKFSIVEFSLAELFSGIREEARAVILLNKGIPLSRWNSRRETRDVKLPTELGKEIYKRTMEGLDILFLKGKVEIVSTATPSAFPDFFEIYSSLMFFNPELTTQDAILLTTAVFEGADYFVTLDGVLVNLNDAFKENYDLRIIKPNKAYNIINQRRRDHA